MSINEDADEPDFTASPEAFERLPAWARRALQKAPGALAAAPAPAAAGDAHARPEWPLLVDAALVASFMPRDLAPGVLSGGARAAAEKSVLEFAQVTHSADGTQWSLTDAARQSVLNASLASGATELQAALQRTASRFHDPISSALRGWVAGHDSTKAKSLKSPIKGLATRNADAYAPSAEKADTPRPTDALRTLEAQRAALALLDGVKLTAAPALTTLDREIGHRRLLRQFERMTGEAPSEEYVQQRNHFYGRAQELETLRSYVAEVEAETIKQKVQRVANALLRPFRAAKPVALWGVGGVGKTTLLAKFMLEHARAAESRFPFAYLDFDRSIISGRNPAALLAEICTQVSTQFEGLTAPLMSLQRQAEELARRAANEKFVPEISSALRELLRHLRGHVDVLLEELEHRFEFRRPFLLVFDTFEAVQYSPDQVQVLESFVRGLSHPDERGLWPRLRLVISGRQEVRRFCGEVESLALGALDPQGSRDMLMELAVMAHKPIPAHLATALVEALATASGGKPSDGVDPLRLRLTGEGFRQNPQQDGAALAQSLLQELRSPPTADRLLGNMFVAGILVRRVLDHVRDPRVRALADPGLVVRHINRDAIRFVMVPATPDPEKTREDIGDADTFEPWQVDAAQAEDIFRAMQRELTLVEANGADLRHRQDVRRQMLPLIRARRPKRFRRVHELAFDFFADAARADPSNHVAAAEAIYHGLWLGMPCQVLDTLWVNDPVFDPRIDVDEFRDQHDANLYLRARLGGTLSTSEVECLPRPFALQWLDMQFASFLEEITPATQLELIRAATSASYEGIAERPRHAAVTARLLYRAGRWRDARWLVHMAFEQHHPSNYGRADEHRDAMISLRRTFATLLAKCEAERRPQLPRELAHPKADPVVHVELLLHAGMHLLSLGDADSHEMFTAATRIGAEVGRSTWSMYLRVLRLLALTSADEWRPMEIYLSFCDRLPREREVRPAIVQLHTLIHGGQLPPELRRIRGLADPYAVLSESNLDEIDAVWRRERKHIGERLGREPQRLLPLLHQIFAVEHYDWRQLIASTLSSALRSNSSLLEALHSFAGARSKNGTPEGTAIVHRAVLEGRFGELIRTLAELQPSGSDDTPALSGMQRYGSFAGYPNSVAPLAQALISWQRRLMALRQRPNVGSELA